VDVAPDAGDLALTDNGGESGASPAPGRRTARDRTLFTVCPYILGNEFCERLAYYGLATNLVVYMTRIMGQDASSAAFHVNLWGGEWGPPTCTYNIAHDLKCLYASGGGEANICLTSMAYHP
jgi:hypothetical protein